MGHSKDIRTRLSTLQTGSTGKLNLIGYGFGDRELEKAIHDEFKNDRIIGEWFKPTEDLLNLVFSLNAMRCVGEEAIPSHIKGLKHIDY